MLSGMASLVDRLLPAELWQRLQPLLPAPPARPRGGVPRRVPDRNCVAACGRSKGGADRRQSDRSRQAAVLDDIPPVAWSTPPPGLAGTAGRWSGPGRGWAASGGCGSAPSAPPNGSTPWRCWPARSTQRSTRTRSCLRPGNHDRQGRGLQASTTVWLSATRTCSPTRRPPRQRSRSSSRACNWPSSQPAARSNPAVGSWASRCRRSASGPSQSTKSMAGRFPPSLPRSRWRSGAAAPPARPAVIGHHGNQRALAEVDREGVLRADSGPLADARPNQDWWAFMGADPRHARPQ
jgi:hypothetical protein